MQHQDLPGDFRANRPQVIAVLNVTVGFEQITDWQVRRRLAVGHGATF